jgi:hypothetical protein
MIIARAADALLRKLIPTVEAAAAVTACSNCAVAYARCEGSYVYEYLHQLFMIASGCKPVGPYCSKRRTTERC